MTATGNLNDLKKSFFFLNLLSDKTIHKWNTVKKRKKKQVMKEAFVLSAPHERLNSPGQR